MGSFPVQGGWQALAREIAPYAQNWGLMTWAVCANVS